MTGTLKLFTSNRMEILAELLAEVLETRLSSTLDKEIIVVQSKGMERWISMELAKRYTICANYRFPFPNSFVYELFRKVIQEFPECSPFDPGVMTWRVMRLLPDLIARPDFENLKTYLDGSGGNLKRFQLSEKIADTFDQYLLYRPDMIFDWERGKGEGWQPVLWRELVRGQENNHRAALGSAFLEVLKKPAVEIKDLPERVSVFGISALPKFHLHILAAISNFTEVNLFLMNPCQEYWGDILSEWGMKVVMEKGGRYGGNEEELHLERGNTLLASMGTLGRDFFDLVNEFGCEEISRFKEPGQDTLLSCLQSDMHNLFDRGQGTNGKKVLRHDDPSIRIHSCHSPRREMEILNDQLLDMFQRDPTLLPKDILVMTPDIETYTPYIQAVFDLPAKDRKRIPFTIADRSIRGESDIIDTFLAILDLCGDRFVASDIMAILESAAVQRKFELSGADLELVFRWVHDTRIRWGIDEENRAALGVPPFRENSWEAGLERLLLGYAMPGNGENLFGGILPYDHIEGTEASVLGKFLNFIRQLFSQATWFSRSRTLDQWTQALTGLLDMFFRSDEDTEAEIQAIRRSLGELGDMKEAAGFHEELGLDVIRYHLSHHLEREGLGFGFISGGLTFCAMLPMRSIPFRVICLVGMDGDGYPRESRPLGFDLMAKHPRRGDRSRRNDDRYLFLEAILSAREGLYISYVGQSVQDNSLMPPSVLVSEIMDYIVQGFEVPGGDILHQVRTNHRLQPFSSVYFKEDRRYFSYAETNFRVARTGLETRKDRTPLINGGLSQPEAEWKSVDIGDLVRFWSHPAKFLINKRLGIYLEEGGTTLEESEPLEVSGLERYHLGQELVTRKIGGEDLRNFMAVVKARGLLPHGTVGECVYDNLSRTIDAFVGKSKEYMEGESPAPVEVDLKVNGFHITGSIAGVYTGGFFQYRYAGVKAKDHMRLWIQHLALNGLGNGDYARSSFLGGLQPRSKEPLFWEYLPVENSKEILGPLLQKYWQGLIKPLHFFPETSWDYLQACVVKNKPVAEGLHQAQKTWDGSDYKLGDGQDPYYRLCFEGTDPLDGEFQELAGEVLGPLLEHVRKA